MKKNNLITIFVIAIICLYVFSVLQKINSAEIVTVKVTDKERITQKSGEDIESKYIVFTESETFENTDSMIFWKFNSSDIQGKLKSGKTYKLKVYGYRIEYLSSYRNIIEIIE